MSQDFEKRAREVLAESVERLDGRTRSRLTQARHAALARLEKAPQRNWLRAYVPAGAAAAVAVLALVMWTGKPPGTDSMTAVTNTEDDMEMLASDAPDFAEADDVEFYEWAEGEIES